MNNASCLVCRHDRHTCLPDSRNSVLGEEYSHRIDWFDNSDHLDYSDNLMLYRSKGHYCSHNAHFDNEFVADACVRNTLADNGIATCVFAVAIACRADASLSGVGQHSYDIVLHAAVVAE